MAAGCRLGRCCQEGARRNLARQCTESEAIYSHTFIHTNTNLHIHTHQNIHTRERAHMNVNLCWSVCTHRCTQNRKHTHTHSHTYTHAHPTQIHQKNRVCARARARVHTHTHTRTHPPTNPHAVYAASFWQCRTASVRPPELLASRRSETRSEIRPQGAKYWHCYR